MKLPKSNQAVVDQAKVCDYLLNPEHRFGASKPRFFAEFGLLPLIRWRRIDDSRTRLHCLLGM
jgi:hypothetical protein